METIGKIICYYCGMGNEELHRNTKRLLQRLNQFTLHVVLYFIFNFSLIWFIFGDLNKRWGLFFVGIVWAIGLIYHALLVYGVDVLARKSKLKSILWGA